MVVRRNNETIDEMIRRLNKQLSIEGWYEEIKKREYYRSKSQMRKYKSNKAEGRRIAKMNKYTHNINYD